MSTREGGQTREYGREWKGGGEGLGEEGREGRRGRNEGEEEGGGEEERRREGRE